MQSFFSGLTTVYAKSGEETEAQAHVLERFYRVDTARSRHAGGAGLGLSIARAIAQLHGGSIQVQNQLGQGSCFTVTLPKANLPVSD